MKKILSVLLSASLLLNVSYAFAEEPNKNPENFEITEDKKEELLEETPTNKYKTVTILLSIKSGFCHLGEKDATLKLTDGEKEYYKTFKISDSIQSQEIIFEVEEYEVEKVFNLIPTNEIG